MIYNILSPFAWYHSRSRNVHVRALERLKLNKVTNYAREKQIFSSENNKAISPHGGSTRANRRNYLVIFVL